ncbi:MAG: MFS transporter [Streptosporangiales bacterium]|nr:MFS transporter [Streptosporangiales bacterium]
MTPSSVVPVDRSQPGGPDPRRPVLIGLMAAVALAAMDGTIVAIAVPAIVQDLGGFSLFPWVFSAYMLAMAVTIPIYGRLADLHGRRPMLLVGTVIFLAGSLLAGFAWDIRVLIAARVLQGIGAGGIQPISQTIAGDLYPLRERGKVQAAFSSVWGVSGVLAPAIGGAFAEYVTWRLIFLINLPVGIAALIMVNRRLKESVERRTHKVDVLGSSLLMAGVGLIVLGLLQGGSAWAWGSAPSVAVFAAGVLALLAFGWWERRAAEPMVPPWVFGRRLLIGANLGSFAVGFLLIGIAAFLPTYATGVLGASALVAGFALAVQSVGWPIAAGLSARLYLRIGFRDTGLTGLGLILISGLLLATVDADSSLAFVAAASFVNGSGLGLLSASMLVGVQSVVGWERRGVVTASSIFARTLGSAVGAAVFGAVANSTLADWFHNAPRGLGPGLPESVDEAGQALDGAPGLSPQVVEYVREGVALATHHVFLGIVITALLGIAAVLMTPRRYEPLKFDDDRA